MGIRPSQPQKPDILANEKRPTDILRLGRVETFAIAAVGSLSTYSAISSGTAVDPDPEASEVSSGTGAKASSSISSLFPIARAFGSTGIVRVGERSPSFGALTLGTAQEVGRRAGLWRLLEFVWKEDTGRGGGMVGDGGEIMPMNGAPGIARYDSSEVGRGDVSSTEFLRLRAGDGLEDDIWRLAETGRLVLRMVDLWRGMEVGGVGLGENGTEGELILGDGGEGVPTNGYAGIAKCVNSEEGRGNVVLVSLGLAAGSSEVVWDCDASAEDICC